VTYYDTGSFFCNYHSKKIKQPNVVQQLEIVYEDTTARYSNDNVRKIPEKVMDFFSMLMYIRKLNPEKFESEKITIDMEGEIFAVSLRLIKEEKIAASGGEINTNKIQLVYQKIDKDQVSVLDYTDIFFWKIASEKGKKYLWIEKEGDRRIIKARFSEGGSWLEAKLIEEK
jgi:hypothetical protein